MLGCETMHLHTRIFLIGWLGCTALLFLAGILALRCSEILMPFMVLTPLVPAAAISATACKAFGLALHSPAWRLLHGSITLVLLSTYYLVAFSPWVTIPATDRAKHVIAILWLLAFGIGGVFLAFLGFKMANPIFSAGSG
jgi:hypothetical protein